MAVLANLRMVQIPTWLGTKQPLNKNKDTTVATADMRPSCPAKAQAKGLSGQWDTE